MAVKMSEIAKELGVAPSGIALSALCKNNRINPMLKWKPINSTIASMTETELNNKNYGLKLDQDINIYTGTAGDCLYYIFLDIAYNGPLSTNFEYDRPTSKFRLGDFRNFVNHSKIDHYPLVYKDNDGFSYYCQSTNPSINLHTNEKPLPSNSIPRNNLYNRAHIRGVLIATINSDDGTNQFTFSGPYQNAYWNTEEINWDDPWIKKEIKPGLNDVLVIEFLVNKQKTNYEYEEYTFTLLPYKTSSTIKLNGINNTTPTPTPTPSPWY